MNEPVPVKKTVLTKEAALASTPTVPAEKFVPTEEATAASRARIAGPIGTPLHHVFVGGVQHSPEEWDKINARRDAVRAVRRKARQERALLNAARRDASKRPAASASSASASRSTVSAKKTVLTEEAALASTPTVPAEKFVPSDAWLEKIIAKFPNLTSLDLSNNHRMFRMFNGSKSARVVSVSFHAMHKEYYNILDVSGVQYVLWSSQRFSVGTKLTVKRKEESHVTVILDLKSTPCPPQPSWQRHAPFACRAVAALGMAVLMRAVFKFFK